jgi:hypothetical protein
LSHNKHLQVNEESWDSNFYSDKKVDHLISQIDEKYEHF